MDRRIDSILKAAEKYKKLAQVQVATSLEAADIQVALGQAEGFGSRGSDAGYFSTNTINSVVSDIANKFGLDDSTNGMVNIVVDGRGGVSFAVSLTNQKQLAPQIAGYLKSKFGADMSRRIAVFVKKSGKQLAPVNAGWLKF